MLWDCRDASLFTVVKDDQLVPFTVVSNITGVVAKPVYEFLQINQTDPAVSVTLIDRSIKPLQLLNGHLVFLTQSGSLQIQNLHSHSHLLGWT